jgi:hypothetical protein
LIELILTRCNCEERMSNERQRGRKDGGIEEEEEKGEKMDMSQSERSK